MEKKRQAEYNRWKAECNPVWHRRNHWLLKYEEDKLLALMTEIIDVKACCNTFVYQLRKNHALAFLVYAKAKREVINKNLARGYYSTPEDIDKLNTNKSEPF